MTDKQNKGIIAAVIVVILAVAGYFLVKMNGQNAVESYTSNNDQNATEKTSASLETTNPAATSANTQTTTNSQSQNTTTQTTPTTNTSPYKDGTYTATGKYISPGGAQAIKVTLTIKDGVVNSTSAVNNASDEESQKYEDKFIAAYKTYVVGKSIDSLTLGKIAGASLTPKGFNDAVNQIKSQAKS